jgi:hypothetical protein
MKQVWNAKESKEPNNVGFATWQDFTVVSSQIARRQPCNWVEV